MCTGVMRIASYDHPTMFMNWPNNSSTSTKSCSLPLPLLGAPPPPDLVTTTTTKATDEETPNVDCKKIVKGPMGSHAY